MDDPSSRGRKLRPQPMSETSLLALVPRFLAPCPSKLCAVSSNKGEREVQHSMPATATATPGRQRSLPYNPGLAIRSASHGSTTPAGRSSRPSAAASSIFNANRNRQQISSAAPPPTSTQRFQQRAPSQGQSAGRSQHLPLSALLSRGSAHASQGASWDHFMAKAQDAQSQPDNLTRRPRSTPESKKKRGQVLCREFVRKLSREQRAVACHPSDSHLMMLAPAGSGKSRTLVGRILWLLQNTPGLREEEVLAVTFTTKAAHEMRERIAHILPEGSLDESASSSSWAMRRGKGSRTAYGQRVIKSVFGEGVLATNFHAMCYKIVQRNVSKLESMNLLKSMPGRRRARADVLTGYKRDKLLRRCIEIAWMKYQSEEQAKKLEIAAQPQQTAVVVGDTPSSKASANASATANTSTERQRAPSSNTSFARASSLYKLDSDSDDDFESDSDNEILIALDAMPANETAEDDGGPKKRLRPSPKHNNIEVPVKGSPHKPSVAPPSPQRSPRRQSLHIKSVVREHFGIANAYIALVKAFMSTDSHRQNVRWPANQVPSIQTRLLDLVFNEYQQALFELRAIDFDDMVALTVRLLQMYPCTAIGCPMFKFILCDEFQDTSKAQLTLLKVLARGGNLSSSKATSKSSTKRNIATAPTSSRVPNAPTHQCRVLVCGDDDQCIYGWRAGTINAFQVFETHFGHEGVKKLFLSENYRCSKVISTAASALIQLNPDRLKAKHNTLSNQDEGRKILLLNCVTPDHEYLEVLNAIHALWEGPRPPAAEGSSNLVASTPHQVILKPKPPLSSICVLARTNALVRDAIAFFKQRGLPVREKDTTGFRKVLESSEAKDVVAYFVLLNASAKSQGQVNDALLRVHCRPPSGVSKKVINELQTLAQNIPNKRLSAFDLLERIATGRDAPTMPDAVAIKMPELLGLHQRFVNLRKALQDHSNVGDMVRTLVATVEYDEFVAGKARKSTHDKAKSCGVLDLLAKRLAQADEDMTALQTGDGGGKLFGARIPATGPRRFDAALRTIFFQEQEKIAEEKQKQQEQQRRTRWASGGYGAKRVDVKRNSGFGQSANVDAKSQSSELDGSGCADGLNVMTIHQAKGLEWDHVFVIRVNEACLPLSDTEAQFAASTGQEAVAALLGGSLEEERRLCYVAFTRARKTLTLSTCRVHRNGDGLLPSRFLLDVPAQFICRKEDLAPPPPTQTEGAVEASSRSVSTNKVVEKVAPNKSDSGSVAVGSGTSGDNSEVGDEFDGDFGDLSEIADELSEEPEDASGFKGRCSINTSKSLDSVGLGQAGLVPKGNVDRGNQSALAAVADEGEHDDDDDFGDLSQVVAELVDDENVVDEFGDLSCVVDDLDDEEV